MSSNAQLTKLAKALISAGVPGKTTGKTPKKEPPGRSRSSSRGAGNNRSASSKRSRSVTPHSGRRVTNRIIRDSILTRLHPVVMKLHALKKQSAILKAGYFDVKDPKAEPSKVQYEIDQLQKEVDLLRDTFRAGLRDRPISMRLSVPFVITTTVTTGVTKLVNVNGTGLGTIDPTQCSEWATMLLLFDEYKVHGGECAFIYYNPVYTTATSFITNNIPVIGYDGGAAGASAASSIALTQLSQHKILPAAATTTAPAGINHRFKWHTPKGTVEAASGSNGLPTDAWMLTDNPTNCGTLQFYHVGIEITAINTGAGIMYIDFQFRCRQ